MKSVRNNFRISRIAALILCILLLPLAATYAKHPTKKRPYTGMVYHPMLEVMKYLRENGYKTYIVTGGGHSWDGGGFGGFRGGGRSLGVIVAF